MAHKKIIFENNIGCNLVNYVAVNHANFIFKYASSAVENKHKFFLKKLKVKKNYTNISTTRQHISERQKITL
jgi:hypothetical protein